MSSKHILEQTTGLKVAIEPWLHQTTGIIASMPHDDFAFLYEPGCGKSFSAVTSARYKMLRDKRHHKVLVVTPLITLKNWVQEWRKFSLIDPKKIVALIGAGPKREKLVGAGAQVFIASYESMIMLKVFAALEAWGPDILIIDEIQKIRNYKAQRSKAVAKMAKLARYRIGLSGTPILNGMLDIFGQFLGVDCGKSFGVNFFTFRAQYFYDKNANMPSQKHFPDWQPRHDTEKLLAAKISKISVTAKKSECLDLPPYIVKDIEVEMVGEQARMYRDMQKEFIAYCDSKACVAPMALTKAVRLSQIVSGFCVLEDVHGVQTEKVFKDNQRKKVLTELLSEIAPYHKVIVWATFKSNYVDIRDVCDSLGLGYIELTGEVSAAGKFTNMDKFDTDNNIRVCIGNAASAAVGVNICIASYSIFYSRSFSLEHDLQAEARNYRGGSEIHEKVTRYNLVTTGTIDELISKRLASKLAVSTSVIKQIAKELKNADS